MLCDCSQEDTFSLEKKHEKTQPTCTSLPTSTDPIQPPHHLLGLPEVPARRLGIASPPKKHIHGWMFP